MSDFIFSVNVTFPIFLVFFSTPSTSFKLELASASTARTGFFLSHKDTVSKARTALSFPRRLFLQRLLPVP